MSTRASGFDLHLKLQFALGAFTRALVINKHFGFLFASWRRQKVILGFRLQCQCQASTPASVFIVLHMLGQEPLGLAASGNGTGSSLAP